MLLEPFEKKVEDTFASHVNAAAATSPLTGRAHQKWGRERKISRALAVADLPHPFPGGERGRGRRGWQSAGATSWRRSWRS
jgi:hypothetical protein